MERYGSILLVLIVAVVFGGCAWGYRSGPRGPESSVVSDGLRYRAATFFDRRDRVRVVTVVLVTNERGRVASVPMIACPVYVRLYASPDRRGLPVWDDGVLARRGAGRRGAGPVDEGASDCGGTRQVVDIGPGETRPLTYVMVEPASFGGVLEPGRYWFTALVPLEGRVVELAAGAGELLTQGS